MSTIQPVIVTADQDVLLGFYTKFDASAGDAVANTAPPEPQRAHVVVLGLTQADARDRPS